MIGPHSAQTSNRNSEGRHTSGSRGHGARDVRGYPLRVKVDFDPLGGLVFEPLWNGTDLRHGLIHDNVLGYNH